VPWRSYAQSLKIVVERYYYCYKEGDLGCEMLRIAYISGAVRNTEWTERIYATY